MRSAQLLRLASACVSLLLFNACASAQHVPVSPRLTAPPAVPYAFRSLPATALNTDSVFVMLTFSGGGTRAAALSYGVLRELEATVIDSGARRRSMLDEVDVISSVSGGSFTAAAFGAWGAAGLTGYEHSFLKWNAEKALIGLGARNAYKWLGRGPYGRSDIAAQLWDSHVFHGVTFGDLIASHRRPMIMINADDMAAGVPFTFTSEWLSPMCIDLSKLTIARAVAASSAFPGLLEPMTLQNHAGECGYVAPGWVRTGLLDAEDNPELFRQAALLTSYTDARKRPYIHLMDGGPADNLGVRPVVRALYSIGSDVSVVQMIDQGTIKHLLIIVVNARTADGSRIDLSPNVPSVVNVLQSAASTPFGNYTDESFGRLREYAKAAQVERDEAKCFDALFVRLGGTPPARRFADVAVVEVGFDHFADSVRRHWFEALPTTFELPVATVDSVIHAGRELLRQNDDFQMAVRKLNGRPAPADTAGPRCLLPQSDN